MLRVLTAGFIGGLVLTLWSAVFSAVGPAGAHAPFAGAASPAVAALRERFNFPEIDLPFGPASANAAPAPQTPSRQPAPRSNVKPPPAIDSIAIAQGVLVSCAAATTAALLMCWFGGPRRPFAERVLFAVLLGAFAGLAMSTPAGGWSQFSMFRSALFLGEVLVGWTLAGMVIAVMLNPKPKKVKA